MVRMNIFDLDSMREFDIVNDYAMFELAGFSIGVNVKEEKEWIRIAKVL